MGIFSSPNETLERIVLYTSNGVLVMKIHLLHLVVEG